MPKPPIPNLRDISVASPLLFRPRLVLRSAAPPTVASPELIALNIDTVFDLRSGLEVAHSHPDDPDAPEQWPGGPRRVHAPVFASADYGPEAVALRMQEYASSRPVAGFVSAYRSILTSGAPAFATVLTYLSSDEWDPSAEKPILLHCTAGKDRTGVACALILSLCGIPDEDVAREYSLTTEGLKDAKPGLLKRLMATPTFDGDAQGAERILSSAPESMMGTLAMIREEWGSVEGYVIKECKLSAETIDRVRQKLLAD
ncbi:tyrosine phosphatase [Trichoderma cornu-damae]|uniref:Tyrosine phosphatase n=1 Tax=Trichoderma cornu-damae TaxID=654480 RepID=A0A9P8TW55_9HYPO|nr:tyrosine phosphatase [Trichoderma cornu-damae]